MPDRREQAGNVKKCVFQFKKPDAGEPLVIQAIQARERRMCAKGGGKHKARRVQATIWVHIWGLGVATPDQT